MLVLARASKLSGGLDGDALTVAMAPESKSSDGRAGAQPRTASTPQHTKQQGKQRNV